MCIRDSCSCTHRFMQLEDAEREIAKRDPDQSGTIEFSEFLSVLEKARASTAREDLERVMGLFSDPSQPGVITMESLRAGADKCGTTLDDEMMGKMLSEVSSTNSTKAVSSEALFGLLKQNDGRQMHDVEI
eukprot:TRINITY_DN12074_c0_g1_i1.p1 TRINITY_DN12074_c0_g1~~TRINITY_DN12074_c0_g1_i1.p1  ORF type:complete len:131 (-),score=47.52 TRINITY_DN12074_c0_g1_i1:236-628(-)